MPFLFITRAQKVSRRINKIFSNKVFTGFADLYSNVQECDATDAPWMFWSQAPKNIEPLPNLYLQRCYINDNLQ
jgi:hypothetical protein